MNFDVHMTKEYEADDHPLGEFRISNGATDFTELRLDIDDEYAEDRRRLILFHEICHATFPDIEEVAIKNMEKLYATLVDNGLLDEQRWKDFVRIETSD